MTAKIQWGMLTGFYFGTGMDPAPPDEIYGAFEKTTKSSERQFDSACQRAFVSIMRFLPSFLLAALFALYPTTGMQAAAEDGAAPKDEISGVIRSQLDALRNNDFQAAYGFAHSGVKEQFTQAQFEQMVRGGFGKMLQWGAVGIAQVNEEGDNAGVQVTLTDGNGNRSAFQYILEKEDGIWRIAGVIPIETADQLT